MLQMQFQRTSLKTNIFLLIAYYYYFPHFQVSTVSNENKAVYEHYLFKAHI